MTHKRILSRGIGSCLCALALFLTSTALAQQAPKQKQAPPAFTREPSLVSPETHSDNKVTFRLSAPDAKEVTISGEWMEGFGASEKIARDNENVKNPDISEILIRIKIAVSTCPGIWEAWV